MCFRQRPDRLSRISALLRSQDKPLLHFLWAQKAGGAEPKERHPGIWPRLAGCQSYIDSEIGRILGKARKIAPDALRLYTSDHGEAGHAHGLFAKGPAVYDEVARVPLIFEGPGVQTGVYEHVVSQIDLPCTVLDHFGAEKPGDFFGESLLPQLKDPSLPTNRPAFVEFTRYEQDHDGFGGFQPMRAIVTDTHKLALHLMDRDEFYDTASDPYDLHDLIGEETQPDIRDELHDRILDFMNRTRDPFRGYQWACRPWRRDKTPSWDVDGMTRQKQTDPGEPCQLDYSTGLPVRNSTRIKP